MTPERKIQTDRDTSGASGGFMGLDHRREAEGDGAVWFLGEEEDVGDLLVARRRYVEGVEEVGDGGAGLEFGEVFAGADADAEAEGDGFGGEAVVEPSARVEFGSAEALGEVSGGHEEAIFEGLDGLAGDLDGGVVLEHDEGGRVVQSETLLPQRPQQRHRGERVRNRFARSRFNDCFRFSAGFGLEVRQPRQVVEHPRDHNGRGLGAGDVELDDVAQESRVVELVFVVRGDHLLQHRPALVRRFGVLDDRGHRRMDSSRQKRGAVEPRPYERDLPQSSSAHGSFAHDRQNLLK
mmetsp:Transcript_10981/g.32955  ORF Transcript_10981/g.32955 Transcript_10981/m.32955 type:complete len:294 (-) Transcript_10981:620-1501(-)